MNDNDASPTRLGSLAAGASVRAGRLQRSGKPIAAALVTVIVGATVAAITTISAPAAQAVPGNPGTPQAPTTTHHAKGLGVDTATVRDVACATPGFNVSWPDAAIHRPVAGGTR